MLKRLFYWISTALLVLWLIAGCFFDLTRAPGALAILRTLGYPAYLCSILVAAKGLAVLALLYPRTRLLREWAYAGIAFDGLGALLSHLAVRDSVGATAAPAIFLGLALASYLLRPAEYRMRSQPAPLPAGVLQESAPLH